MKFTLTMAVTLTWVQVRESTRPVKNVMGVVTVAGKKISSFYGELNSVILFVVNISVEKSKVLN